MHFARQLVGALVACLAGLGVSSEGQSATDVKKLLEVLDKRPPLEFFVAKGALDSCGPGCDTWIAAEGRFDDDAAAHFRRFIDKMGNRKLPIYFSSLGGRMWQSFAIGRMLRSRGMTGGVARTVLAHCMPARSVADCGKALRDSPGSEAALITDGAVCESACPYAVFGAMTRMVEPAVLFGVHTALTYLTGNTARLSERQRDRLLDAHQREDDRLTARYVAEMGIDRKFLEVVRHTPFETMHFLTRRELFELGIDRRDNLLSDWNIGVLDLASIGYAAYVNVPLRPKMETAALSNDQIKPTTIALSCAFRSTSGYLLTSLRPIPTWSARSESDLMFGVGRAGVLLTARSSFLTTIKDDLFEVRQVRLSKNALETIERMSNLTISGDLRRADATAEAIAADAPASSTYGQTVIPAKGLVNAFDAMIRRCEAGEVMWR